MTKTIDDIYGEMLEVFAQESGYLPASSCDLAVRLYAAAAQIQSLLIQAQWVLDQSFPQTAQGEYLDRLAALRGISRSIATCATGNLRFGVSSAIGGDLSIAAGTTCMTPDGIRFATTDNAVLSAGSLYVDVPAMALAVAQSSAVKLLIPMNHCNNVVVGLQNCPIAVLIGHAADWLAGHCQA